MTKILEAIYPRAVLTAFAVLCFATMSINMIEGVGAFVPASSRSYVTKEMTANRHKTLSENSYAQQQHTTIGSTRRKRKGFSSSLTSLFVSVGLGPSNKKQEEQDEEDKELYMLQRLEDMKLPTSDEERLSQMSLTDKKCDEWFTNLLGDASKRSPLDDSVVNPIRDMLLQKVMPSDCMDEVVRNSEEGGDEWTPYAKRTLKDTMFIPPYGLETFGIPIPRRNAEPWRQFDVPGMIQQSYGGTPDHIDEPLILNGAQTVHANSCLTMNSGTWLAAADKMDCAARLVYVDGRYCPTLSITTNESDKFTVTNIKTSSKSECDLLSEEHIHALQHLPDGFTDVVPIDIDEHLDDGNNDEEKDSNNSGPPSTADEQQPMLISQLSGVDHRVGKARSRFAMNNQQGTAAFAALNTLKCHNIALVDIPSNVHVEKPIFIINAYSNTTTTTDEKLNEEGISYHPRLLMIGHKNSHANIIQATVDIDLTPKSGNGDDEEKASVSSLSPPSPRMHNGYTQIYVKQNANITHTYVQENGGKVIAGVEGNDNDDDDDAVGSNDKSSTSARDLEASRPEQRDLHMECFDVHVMGKKGTYKGNVLTFGGMGRSRMSVGLSLAQRGAKGSINGLMLNGGLQRGDMRTTIHHIAQGCTSRQQQRNMAGGRASQTFKGRIRVEQDAQQTDSDQLARTILLTDKARIWAMPSLEIIADDVQCTHGATVSDLSEEELFYLRSRGLQPTLSRNLLMYAFVDEIGREVPSNILGNESSGGLKQQMISRLQNLVPKGQRAVMGEFQSV